MNVIRKVTTLGAGALVCSMVLASCSGSGSGSRVTAAEEKPSSFEGELNLLIGGDAPQGEDPLVASFEADNPDLDVNAEYIPVIAWEEFFAAVQTRLAGGAKYDLIYLPTEGEKLFVSKQLVAPLDSWLDRDDAELQEFYADANPSILEAAKRLGSDDDQTYYLPFIFNTMGMYLNKSVFEEAGVPLPDPDWTWDDFRATCEQLSGAQSLEYCFGASPEFFAGIEPWLTTNGANVLDAEWKTATADTPEAIESVSFVRGLVEDGLAPVPGGEYDAAALFHQDKLAMVGGGAWITSQILGAGASLDDMAIVPWPQNAQHGSPVGWGAWGMMRDAANPEAAWEFIKSMLSPEMQRTIGEQRVNGAIPVLNSAVDSAVEVNPEGYRYLFDALDYATPVPGPSAAALVQQSTVETYTNILTGSVSPEEGMAALQEKLAEAVDE